MNSSFDLPGTKSLNRCRGRRQLLALVRRLLMMNDNHPFHPPRYRTVTNMPTVGGRTGGAKRRPCAAALLGATIYFWLALDSTHSTFLDRKLANNSFRFARSESTIKSA